MLGLILQRFPSPTKVTNVILPSDDVLGRGSHPKLASSNLCFGRVFGRIFGRIFKSIESPPWSQISPTSRVDMTCGGAADNNNDIRGGFLSIAAVVYPGRDLGVMLHFWKVITQL